MKDNLQQYFKQLEIFKKDTSLPMPRLELNAFIGSKEFGINIIMRYKDNNIMKTTFSSLKVDEDFNLKVDKEVSNLLESNFKLELEEQKNYLKNYFDGNIFEIYRSIDSNTGIKKFNI